MIGYALIQLLGSAYIPSILSWKLVLNRILLNALNYRRYLVANCLISSVLQNNLRFASMWKRGIIAELNKKENYIVESLIKRNLLFAENLEEIFASMRIVLMKICPFRSINNWLVLMYHCRLIIISVLIMICSVSSWMKPILFVFIPMKIPTLAFRYLSRFYKLNLCAKVPKL